MMANVHAKSTMESLMPVLNRAFHSMPHAKKMKFPHHSMPLHTFHLLANQPRTFTERSQTAWFPLLAKSRLHGGLAAKRLAKPKMPRIKGASPTESGFS